MTEAYAGVGNLEVLTEARRYNAFLVSAVLVAADGAPRALDFGAGIGTLALALRERGTDVVCIEPDAGMRERLQRQGLTAHADLGGVAPRSLPYAYSLNVLEHIEDDAGALRDLRDRLAPGGRLFLYVPAFQVLFSTMDRKVGHFRRYRRAPLCALVERAGLVVERAEYVDSLGFLASLAYKAVGSRTGDVSLRSVRFYDRFVFPVSRWLDLLSRRVGGKNLLVIARRPR